MTPSRFLGPGAKNTADLSYKYKQFLGSPDRQHKDNKSVTRHLAQASEKKKERLRYADPYDQPIYDAAVALYCRRFRVQRLGTPRFGPCAT